MYGIALYHQLFLITCNSSSEYAQFRGAYPAESMQAGNPGEEALSVNQQARFARLLIKHEWAYMCMSTIMLYWRFQTVKKVWIPIVNLAYKNERLFSSIAGEYEDVQIAINVSYSHLYCIRSDYLMEIRQAIHQQPGNTIQLLNHRWETVLVCMLSNKDIQPSCNLV